MIRYESHITLPNDVQQIGSLASFVDEAAEAARIDMTVAMSLNLAMEEAVVNVMNYAYPPEDHGDVDIHCVCEDHELRFIITDTGTPFDPTKVKAADTTLSAEDRPIGGLGIHLVRQLMDDMSYSYTDGKNILTLTKKI